VWDRAEKDASFCTQGELFIDSTSSGDVIQGSLGDCWFLGTHQANTYKQKGRGKGQGRERESMTERTGALT
jgi:hypothetical protein